MFTEPYTKGERRGWIEVICGSMFSGKTEELIRRLKRARIANMKVAIFKPSIDKRYHEQQIVSHDENAILSTPVENAASILSFVHKTDVIGIDEIQFFDDDILVVCNQLALQGIRVIVAGLDMDYAGKPFGQVPGLLATAEYITKLHAICARCGNIANYSYRKTSGEGEAQIIIGESNIYEPRCRHCYNMEE
ncbi:thymidine kinase [Agriterribacter sp.]|uniref:thymidine kinase n=1 Tax=Agriterribacter sp. TaxID=2821509 RepID=UPI002BF54D4B|nr:thymidine kinase [Agriterribacter sp.]HTN07674.1 thymidine kinase [Agriterribacter sp.]